MSGFWLLAGALRAAAMGDAAAEAAATAVAGVGPHALEALQADDACAGAAERGGRSACALSFMDMQKRQWKVDRELPSPGLRQEVDEVRAVVQTKPHWGCMQVINLLNAHRVPGKFSVFGAPVTQLDLLDTGIGEVAALGLLASLAAEESDATTAAGQTCFTAICLLGVQYDHDRSLAVYNTSPSLWPALVAWTKRVMGNHELLRTSLVMYAGVYGAPPSDDALYALDEAGGFDVMFDVLENNSTDLVVAQAAWAGLSDNVGNSRAGSMLVADHGGPSKGLDFLVKLLKAYHGQHAYQPGMPFGIRYESLHVVNEILRHDDENKTWLKVALGAGYLEEAVVTMREEPGDRRTQENACDAIALMTTDNATGQKLLRELGAIELMASAIDRFHMEYACKLDGMD
mmetsp:Transcript_125114/g.348149  ORF Transcript_125114/g.348149 Transcript_125114/m.348149 type:complete len:402 (+) Transcript_125114:101-1306(+)